MSTRAIVHIEYMLGSCVDSYIHFQNCYVPKIKTKLVRQSPAYKEWINPAGEALRDYKKVRCTTDSEA